MLILHLCTKKNINKHSTEHYVKTSSLINIAATVAYWLIDMIQVHRDAFNGEENTFIIREKFKITDDY